jgi:pimeloyl-ACP methyl ester carboxylesterase
MGNPTIVIVHGAMHCREHYEPLMQNLESKGYKCVTVALPSTQSIDTPPAGLADDTAAVRSVVLNELDKEKNDVIVLAHSYGGVPANNALYELDEKTRSSNGHTTSVKAIAFMCALPIPKGSTAGGFMSSRGGDGSAQAKSAVEMDSTGTFGLPKGSPGPEEALFNDLPSEEATIWARMLRPVSIRVMGEETTYAAYVDVPTGYLYCSIDESLPLVAQEFVVAEAKKAGAKIVLEQTVDAGHSPFLSQIEQTASFVQKVVELTR